MIEFSRENGYNKVMPKHLIPVLSLLSAVVLLVMLNFTAPADIGPLGVLVFFVAVFLMFYGVAYMLVKMFTRLSGHKTGRKTYIYAAIFAFGPLMLLLAESLGSINVLTCALTGLFMILACFLVGKR